MTAYKESVKTKEYMDMSEINDLKQWNITHQQVWFSRGGVERMSGGRWRVTV